MVCSIGIKYLKSDPILDLLFMTNTHFNNKILRKKKKEFLQPNKSGSFASCYVFGIGYSTKSFISWKILSKLNNLRFHIILYLRQMDFVQRP